MPFNLSRRGLLAGAAVAAAAPLPRLSLARAQEAAAAPQPVFYPRRVGELEVTAISDGYFAADGQIFVNVPPAELEAALTAAFLPTSAPMQLGVTAHLVRGGGRTMLIDAGTADLFGPTLGDLPAGLAALGVAPEAVDALILTHMHPDHLGGALAGGAAAFPNAALHVNEAELAFWTDEAIAASAPEGVRPFFARARATAEAYGDRVVIFASDAEVTPGVTSLFLPGHTPGHSGFRLSSGGEEILVIGDAVSSAAVQFSHPEVGLVFDTDAELAAETRGALFDMLSTDKALVAATHLPFPGIGHVARSGQAFAWVPEEWRYQ